MRQLGVIGFGSFGRFMATHLKDHFDLLVHDLRPVADVALELGVKEADLDAVIACEGLVVAVPVQDMKEVLIEVARRDSRPRWVVDVASVKSRPVEMMREVLPADVDFGGLHPMFGPQSGRDGIAGLKVVWCEGRGDLSSVTDFLSSTLELEVIPMTPEDHDYEMAYIQGLTHWIAKALREIKLPNENLATPAYRHLLSIEAILREDSFELFRTIEVENPFAASARRELLDRLNEIERDLDDA